MFESGKPADARTLFEQVVQQAPKPIAAEAALRSGQCRLADAKKQIEAATQAKNQAGNDAAKKAAAEQQFTNAKAAVTQAADELRGPGRTVQGRAADAARPAPGMLYDAAWACRGVADAKTPLAYQLLIDEFPDTALAVDARFELAELRADRGDHDAAVKLLKDALDKEPADRPVPPDTTERIRLRLGACLAAKKDYPAAAAQFEAVAANAKSPYLAQADLPLRRVPRRRRRVREGGREARGLPRQARVPQPRRRQRPGDAPARPGAGRAEAVRAGPADLRGAHPAVRPEQPVRRRGPLRRRVGACSSQGKYDEAVAAYQQVIAATQAEVAAKAQVQIGQCRLAQKKYAEAANAFLVVPYTYDYPEVGLRGAAGGGPGLRRGQQAGRRREGAAEGAQGRAEGQRVGEGEQERLGKLKK